MDAPPIVNPWLNLSHEIDAWTREVSFETTRVRRHLRTASVLLADVCEAAIHLDGDKNHRAVWSMRARELRAIVSDIED